MYYNIRKLAVSIFWIVLGAALVALGVLEKIDSYYSGLGGGLVAVGILQVSRNIKYHKNPEYKEKIDISYNDERLKEIRTKAWAITGYVVLIIMAVGSIALKSLGNDVACLMLSRCVCIELLIFILIYVVLNKKL